MYAWRASSRSKWIEPQVGAERAASAGHAAEPWACAGGSRDRRRHPWRRGLSTHPQGVWLISCRKHEDRSFELPTFNCNDDEFDEPETYDCSKTVQRTNAVLKERIRSIRQRTFKSKYCPEDSIGDFIEPIGIIGFNVGIGVTCLLDVVSEVLEALKWREAEARNC
jgi:hypothetical protein